MQDRIKIEDVVILQPDDDGYQAELATTSTEDSDRDMGLNMHNTPIGTVFGYNLKWTSPPAKEVSKILKLVLNKSQFKMHYYDIVEAAWMDGDFYASNFSSPSRSLEEDAEVWDSLSFNVRSIGAKK